MSSSERFSWFDPPKKSRKSSSELTYVNAPIGQSSTEQVDMSQKHERDIDLHPRVLPTPLFEKLVAGDKDTAVSNKAHGNLPHVPIPVERRAPPPAVAERPVYQAARAESAASAAEPERFMAMESEPAHKPDVSSSVRPASPIETFAHFGPEQPSALPPTTGPAEYYVQKRGLRRGLVAGFITGYALHQFLMNRQQRLPEAPAEQQAQPVNPGEQVALRPGQRLERRGWYSVVVDEHGREVQGALNYGEAFHQEQRQEQAPPATGGAAQDDGAQAAQDATYLGAMGAPAVDGMLASGQIDPSHTLGQGQPHPIDPNHRLSRRQNPIIATIANPVLWLGFAVIIIAYFIIALL